MAKTSTGQFVWYELMTPDTAKSIDYYTSVIGWKAQPFDDKYTMWVSDQGPLGGVMGISEDEKKMGAFPQWLASVQVDDVDKTAALAREFGGACHVQPLDIPKVGRYAVLGDPQGPGFSVFKPLEPMTAHDTSKHGQFNWNELATSDHSAAFGFYSKLFGWEKIEEHDMGPIGKYLLFGLDGKAFGGMFTKPKDMPMPPSWTYYIQVDDLEGAVAKATAKGGRVLNGPMDVPGGTRIAQLTDAQGVPFALHAMGKTTATQ